LYYSSGGVVGVWVVGMGGVWVVSSVWVGGGGVVGVVWVAGRVTSWVVEVGWVDSINSCYWMAGHGGVRETLSETLYM